METYEHISESERRRIERLTASKWGVRGIATALGRGIGTISDELRRNKVKGTYDAKKAEAQGIRAQEIQQAAMLEGGEQQRFATVRRRETQTGMVSGTHCRAHQKD